MSDKPSPQEVRDSIHKSFIENVKPIWDAIDKHTIRIGSLTIIDCRNLSPNPHNKEVERNGRLISTCTKQAN